MVFFKVVFTTCQYTPFSCSGFVLTHHADGIHFRYVHAIHFSPRHFFNLNLVGVDVNYKAILTFLIQGSKPFLLLRSFKILARLTYLKMLSIFTLIFHQHF